MKRMSSIATSLTIMALLFAGIASAQDNAQKLTANVPFDFVVGRMTLPAGQYAFVRTGAQTMLVRDMDGRGLFTLVTQTQQAPEIAAHSSLQFANVGGTHVLVGVWNDRDGIGTELQNSYALSGIVR